MENKDRAEDQEQLEEHSLPGTNQAGKGPGTCEDDDQDSRSTDGGKAESEPARGPKLPGTRQGGKSR